MNGMRLFEVLAELYMRGIRFVYWHGEVPHAAWREPVWGVDDVDGSEDHAVLLLAGVPVANGCCSVPDREVFYPPRGEGS